jgi:hypothetical protein
MLVPDTLIFLSVTEAVPTRGAVAVPVTVIFFSVTAPVPVALEDATLTSTSTQKFDEVNVEVG